MIEVLTDKWPILSVSFLDPIADFDFTGAGTAEGEDCSVSRGVELGRD